MSESSHERHGDDKRYPDENGANSEPNDNKDRSEDRRINDLERALESVREVEDG